MAGLRLSSRQRIGTSMRELGRRNSVGLSARSSNGTSLIERLPSVQQDNSQRPLTTRREFLSLSGRTLVAGLALPACAHASGDLSGSEDRAGTESAQSVVKRLLPNHAEQIHLHLAPHAGSERFQIGRAHV